MGRTAGLPFVVCLTLAGVLGSGTAAAAQPPSVPAIPPVAFAAAACSAPDGAGNQLCSSDRGVLEVVPGPGGAPAARLGLTTVRELRRGGAVVARGEEQRSDHDLIGTGAAELALSRSGQVFATDAVRCTYDDRTAVAGRALQRGLSNLACTGLTPAAPTPAAPATTPAAPAPQARAAASSSPTSTTRTTSTPRSTSSARTTSTPTTTSSAKATSTSRTTSSPATSTAAAPTSGGLPAYADYSAVNTAPNGAGTRIRYGTVGQGNPAVADCTVTTTTNPQAAVDAAPAGAVVCVRPGDYSGSTLTVGKAVTVRANGVVKVRNIVVTGSNAVVDGFQVVGGTLGSPNYAIKFSGTGHRIVNNLVRGRGIWYAIGCDQGAGCGKNVLIAGNTVTGVHNFGIFLWGGDAITVERNNVFDLFQSTNVDDVDAMRAWGTNHVIRNNYFHDINKNKSAGSPHSDCFQSYQSGGSPRLSSGILFENNYCVRVTGQCVILQNDQRNAAELHDYVIRGNVCETYGWQAIEITGVPNVTMDNDYVAGVQTTVLNFANSGAGGRVSSNYKVRNTVLVRATAGSRFLDGTPADNTANRTLVDPAVKTSYDGFAASTAAYPPVRSTDFDRFYRDSVGRAAPPVGDAGAPPNSPAPPGDVDGGPRVVGTVDVGPFELG
ncbi:MAG TPA: right-handed parallel beta-helix repeat-containing protein [Pseudonocardia sp.]